ncbi:MAG: Maltose acetyltransferase [Bogoriella megaspora]|nr:MAG: Maltose acetyltransferase [Bogoriella megaspora]
MASKTEFGQSNGSAMPDKADGRESSANGFTAVNGRVSPEQAAKGHVSTDKPRRSEVPSGPEAGGSLQQSKDWHRRSNGTAQSESISPTASSIAYPGTSPKKRKRSFSHEATNSENTQYDGLPDPRRYREPSDSGLGRDSPESSKNSVHYNDEKGRTVPPQSHQDYRPPELSSYRANDGDPHYTQQRPSSPQAEARLAEALQRETQGASQPTIQFQPGMTMANGVPTAPPKNRTGPERPPVIQIDKKRKRCGLINAFASRASQPSQYRDPAVQHIPDGQRARPIMLEDEREAHVARQPWPQQPWADANHQPHPPYYPENIPRDVYSNAPPVAQSPREQPPPPPPPVPQQREYHPAQMPRPMSHSASSQQAVTAQLALQHATTNGPPPPPQPRSHQQLSEKDKMLAGELHMPYSPQLVEEREQCTAALWRFNNTTNPSVGVSREERSRLFRAIIEPPYLRTHVGQPSPANPIGSVGRDVSVETPFQCDYGYNINIGDYTVIGKNCTIMDPCTITIGVGCIIGPNVSIYGMSMPLDPRRRSGCRGGAVGSRVTIGDNVYIGGGVTILPKVTIGKNATIGAGSVVTKDVRENTVVAGNPAVFRRYA